MSSHETFTLAEQVGRLDMLLEQLNITQQVFALFRGLNRKFKEAYEKKDDIGILGSLMESDNNLVKILEDPKFLMGYKVSIATGLDFCSVFMHNFRDAGHFIRKEDEKPSEFAEKVKELEKRVENFIPKVLNARTWKELDGMFEELRDTVNRPISAMFFEYLRQKYDKKE